MANPVQLVIAGATSDVPISATNPLPVSASITPSGTQDVNLTQVAGVAVKTGNGTASGAQRVTLASDSTGTLNVRNVSTVGYETVAASQTAQVLGGSGATGDWLTGLLVIPATTSPGLVTVLDNAISIPVFVGGTVGSVIPFWVNVGCNSVSGAWKVTTGSNVSVLAIGNFT